MVKTDSLLDVCVFMDLQCFTIQHPTKSHRNAPGSDVNYKRVLCALSAVDDPAKVIFVRCKDLSEALSRLN